MHASCRHRTASHTTHEHAHVTNRQGCHVLSGTKHSANTMSPPRRFTQTVDSAAAVDSCSRVSARCESGRCWPPCALSWFRHRRSSARGVARRGQLTDVEGTAPFRSVRRPRQRGLLVASLNRHLSALKAQRASLRFCPGSFYTVTAGVSVRGREFPVSGFSGSAPPEGGIGKSECTSLRWVTFRRE